MKRALAFFALCLLSCRCQSRQHGSAPPVTQPAPTLFSQAQESWKEETMKCPQVLVDARRDGTNAGAYVPPNASELAAIEGAVAALLVSDEATAKTRAAAAGFAIAGVPEWPGTIALVESGKRRGGGAYVFRRGSTSRLLVQAPHTFFDEGTFGLGCALFQHADARALFINTVHRYKAAPAGQSADVAHLGTSLFQSATVGAVRGVPAPTVVQLHGFTDERVRFADGTKAVVSSGVSRRQDHVERVARALDAVLGGGVLRFPDDTSELGATTNAQGKVVRAAGGTFLHVEMSEQTRDLLGSDAAKRRSAFDALLGVMGERR